MNASGTTSTADLISTKEVAARKGVTVKTVNLWAQKGLLPVAEIVPMIGARLFDPSVVDAFDPKAAPAASAPVVDRPSVDDGGSSSSPSAEKRSA